MYIKKKYTQMAE